jgi:hypothetical protein
MKGSRLLDRKRTRCSGFCRASCSSSFLIDLQNLNQFPFGQVVFLLLALLQRFELLHEVPCQHRLPLLPVSHGELVESRCILRLQLLAFSNSLSARSS